MSTNRSISTVRRNTKRHAEALSSGYDAYSYSLSNDFVGTPVSMDVVHEYVTGRFSSLKPKMTCSPHSRGGSVYTVHVHSNLWLEFRA